MATIVVNNQKGNTVVVNRDRSVATVTRSTASVQVAAPGPQGRPGPSGQAGGAIAPVSFAYGDASPTVVYTLPSASEVAAVSLQYEEAFDGAGASVALGVASDPDSLIPAADNDPASEATFEFSPRVEYPAGTQLLLTVNPGAGATQGRGELLFSIIPLS